MTISALNRIAYLVSIGRPNRNYRELCKRAFFSVLFPSSSRLPASRLSAGCPSLFSLPPSYGERSHQYSDGFSFLAIERDKTLPTNGRGHA